MGQLFDELKRRNVFRVAAAYAVVGWVILQVATSIEEPLGLPDWTDTLVIVLLALGLPIALLFAWAFEMTPEGLKKTKEVDKEASVTRATGQKINILIGGALVLALGFIAWQNLTSGDGVSPVGQTRAAELSIAVLPFADMSPDGDQEYFTDGISEEILNVLAKIPELRVAARTSSFQFKDKNRDITEIGRQLGVAHVLEGSVRKSGVRIRITAQLIKADTGFHLWSETYDRDLDDIFAVQDEISVAIVAALSHALGLESVSAPARIKAAANTEAYNAYLLGQYLIRKRTKRDIEASILNFEKAIELDPDYAPAHAALALAWRLLMASNETYGNLTLEQSLAGALPHIERALALDPELAVAHGVMGLILDAQGRTELALDHFEKALSLNPSLTDVRNWYALELVDLGRQKEAFREMEIAYRLDPLSRLNNNNYADILLQLRRFSDMEPVLERMDQIVPAGAATFRGLALFDQLKAAEGAVTLFRGVDASPDDLRLKAATAIQGLRNLGLSDEALRFWPFPDGGWGIISGETDYDLILEMAQQRYQDDPDNPDTLTSLAWAYFNTGDREQAERLATRHLNRLGPAKRPIAFTNFVAVLNAWAASDEAAMLARLAPLEATADSALDAGIDISFLHWAKAQSAFLRGLPDEAYGHAKRAFSIGTDSPNAIDFPYRHLGWDKIPRFRALRESYEAYLAAERLKLLAVACGDDGFEVWQPLPETCAMLDQG